MLNLASLLRILVVVVLGALPAAALAELPDQSNREAIRLMIRDQIEAFHRGDGAAAFSHASPQIQDLFQSPDKFMAMVRQSYAPVYGARSVAFGVLVDDDGVFVQPVYLVGPGGHNWIAVYSIEQQGAGNRGPVTGDGTWRIKGVALVRDSGASI